jgi:predicted site-specific integrase-resolvase
MTEPLEYGDDLLTPAEVAGMFRVNTARVGIWARAGRIGFVLTPGGTKRYRRSEAEALRAAAEVPRWES